jgi:hypothetical protein
MIKPTKPDQQPVKIGRLAVDEQTIAKLSALGAARCSLAEAALSLSVTEDYLQKFLKKNPSARAAYETAGAEALENLRAAQLKLAQTSSTMAIFLGKNYLGQTDRRELESSAQAAYAAQIADAADAKRRLRLKLATLATDRDPPSGGETGGDPG